MKWIVLVYIYRPGGIVKYKKHTFDTKKQAEDFRSKLKSASEMYSVSYKKEGVNKLMNSNEKDFILAIENMKIEILKNSDNLNSYELSNIKKHARDLYESLVWLQYEAEERE